MSFLWALGGFFLILTPIILVHEYGHFIAARLSNIRVEEFGLGFPPRAATLFEQKGTKFTLNWIPLGGFVRPAGEDDSTVVDGFASAPKRARFLVLVAGSLANFVLAFLLFWGLNLMPQELVDETQIAISTVSPESPAEAAGLQEGDVFVSINGESIGGDFEDLLAEVSENLGNQIPIVVSRGEEVVETRLRPRLPDEYAPGDGAVGVRMVHPPTGEVLQYGMFQAAAVSLGDIWNIAYLTFEMPVRWFRGQIDSSEARFVSVVGISQMAGQATQQSVNTGDVRYVVSLAGLISVALGFTNLLPIPALDGGRIIFVLLEAIRGRRIEPEYEERVHMIGMAFLLVLMVFLMAQDVINPIVPPS